MHAFHIQARSVSSPNSLLDDTLHTERSLNTRDSSPLSSVLSDDDPHDYNETVSSIFKGVRSLILLLHPPNAYGRYRKRQPTRSLPVLPFRNQSAHLPTVSKSYRRQDPLRFVYLLPRLQLGQWPNKHPNQDDLFTTSCLRRDLTAHLQASWVLKKQRRIRRTEKRGVKFRRQIQVLLTTTT